MKDEIEKLMEEKKSEEVLSKRLRKLHTALCIKGVIIEPIVMYGTDKERYLREEIYKAISYLQYLKERSLNDSKNI